VTFTKWQVIYWLQVGMVGFGLALSLFFVPDSKRSMQTGKTKIISSKWTIEDHYSKFRILAKFNPRGIFRLLIYRTSFLLVGYSTSKLSRRPLSYKTCHRI